LIESKIVECIEGVHQFNRYFDLFHPCTKAIILLGGFVAMLGYLFSLIENLKKVNSGSCAEPEESVSSIS